MAYSDMPQPSLFGCWPLRRFGQFIAFKAHGRNLDADGSLLTRKHRIQEDDIWRLGQAYFGILGLLALPLALMYLHYFHQDTGTVTYHYDALNRRVAKHRLGFFEDLPLDLKIIMPLTFLLHFGGLLSAVRWGMLVNSMSRRSDVS